MTQCGAALLLTISPVVVGAVPPCVSTPAPGTLPILGALSALTRTDLPELAVAVQRSDLARRRLHGVAVVKAVGSDGLVLQTEIVRQLCKTLSPVHRRRKRPSLSTGGFTLTLTSCSTESKESQKVSLSESLVKTKPSDTPESVVAKQHFSYNINMQYYVKGSTTTIFWFRYISVTV